MRYFYFEFCEDLEKSSNVTFLPVRFKFGIIKIKNELWIQKKGLFTLSKQIWRLGNILIIFIYYCLLNSFTCSLNHSFNYYYYSSFGCLFALAQLLMELCLDKITWLSINCFYCVVGVTRDGTVSRAPSVLGIS
jgi:hypothetical protein